MFKLTLEEIIPSVETYLSSSILGIRGRVDLLLNDVIFELKVNFDREYDDGIEEIKKYSNILREKYPNRKFVAILTDLIKFEALLPIFDENGNVELKKISMINIENVSTEDFIMWIDSHFFSQTGITPTAKELNRTFGIESPHFVIMEEELKILWSQVSSKTDIMLKYEL